MSVKSAAGLLAAILVPVAAAPAMAQAGTATVAPGKADKKICRTVEQIGSIMGGTRTCHTKAEWAAIDQRNNDNIAASRDVNGQGGNRQGGGGI